MQFHLTVLSFAQIMMIIMVGLVSTSEVWGHGTVNSDPSVEIYRTKILMERLSRLDIQPASKSDRSVHPVVAQGGYKIKINSAFYDFAEALAELYVTEIEQECPPCEVPTAEQLTSELRQRIARGWLRSTTNGVYRRIVIGVGGELAYLYGSFGPIAAILKGMGEALEEAMFFTGQGLAHFACEAITAVVAVWSKATNSLLRTNWNSGQMGLNPWLTTCRMAGVSWMTRKLRRRLSLIYGPIESKDDVLTAVNGSGDLTWHWLAEEIQHGGKVRDFLDRLIASSESSGPHEMVIKRKHFERARSWYTFGLFRYNRRHSLRALSQGINFAFKGSALWMIPLTSGILNPAVQELENTPSVLADLKPGRPSRSEPIDDILLAESEGRGLNREELAKLLPEVGMTFDHTLPVRERYSRFQWVQAVLSDVLPKLMNRHISRLAKEFYDQDDTVFEITGKIYSLRKKVGELRFYADQYLDFVRLANFSRTPIPDPLRSDLAKDYLALIFEGFQTIRDLDPYGSLDVASSGAAESTLDEAIVRLNFQIKRLKARRFWVEKRTSFKSLPLREPIFSFVGLKSWSLLSRKRPQCKELHHSF